MIFMLQSAEMCFCYQMKASEHVLGQFRCVSGMCSVQSNNVEHTNFMLSFSEKMNVRCKN